MVEFIATQTKKPFYSLTKDAKVFHKESKGCSPHRSKASLPGKVREREREHRPHYTGSQDGVGHMLSLASHKM